jgi:hypothetical protein
VDAGFENSRAAHHAAQYAQPPEAGTLLRAHGKRAFRGVCPRWRAPVLLTRYWMELPTDENTLLALLPTNRIVPTTITRITASITAYSAMSCPRSSRHRLRKVLIMVAPSDSKPPQLTKRSGGVVLFRDVSGWTEAERLGTQLQLVRIMLRLAVGCQAGNGSLGALRACFGGFALPISLHSAQRIVTSAYPRLGRQRFFRRHAHPKVVGPRLSWHVHPGFFAVQFGV